LGNFAAVISRLASTRVSLWLADSRKFPCCPWHPKIFKPPLTCAVVRERHQMLALTLLVAQSTLVLSSFVRIGAPREIQSRRDTGGQQSQVGLSTSQAAEPSTMPFAQRLTCTISDACAHLEADPSLKDKIVVFDDPFTSQDNFRRGQTVHAIRKLAGSCRQLLVLSHDATFLKQIWSKSPASERASLTLADHRDLSSKLHEIDLEKACQGRTAADIDDLQLFLSTGAGGLLDVVRKMRVVLETYLRTTYPSCFRENEWLGDMVGKIRDGGASPLLRPFMAS
jgi:hypothetical protein